MCHHRPDSLCRTIHTVKDLTHSPHAVKLYWLTLTHFTYTQTPTYIQSKPWWRRLFLSDWKCSVGNFLPVLQKRERISGSFPLPPPCSSFTALRFPPADKGLSAKKSKIFRSISPIHCRWLVSSCCWINAMKVLRDVLQYTGARCHLTCRWRKNDCFLSFIWNYAPQQWTGV